MPISAINVYMERLPARIAELKLAMADAASFPHMTKSARGSVIREWTRTAKKYGGDAAIVISPARLQALGIGVKRHKVTNGQ